MPQIIRGLLKPIFPSWWIKKRPLCQVGACQHTSADDVGLSAVLSASARSGRTHTHAHMKTCMDARVSCVHLWLCHGTGMPSHERGGKKRGALNELERHNARLFLSGETAQALKAGLSVNTGAFRSLEACFFFFFPQTGCTSRVYGWHTSCLGLIDSNTRVNT